MFYTIKLIKLLNKIHLKNKNDDDISVNIDVKKIDVYLK